MPGRGIGFGLSRFPPAGEAAGELRRLPHPEVSFNYLGQIDFSLPGASFFEPSNEPCGPARDPRGRRSHLLELNGGVVGDRLEMRFTYSRNRYRRATVEDLAQGFIEQLEGLIAHCRSPGAGGHTPSDFPLAELEQPALDRLFGHDAGIDDVYPVAPTQEAMFYFRRYAPASRAYFGEITLQLSGRIEPARIRRAWQRLLKRHSALRTAFLWQDLDRPLQVVHSAVEVPWTEIDWRRLSGADQRRLLDSFRRTERCREFDFARPPLLRLSLIRVAEHTRFLTWCQHHILLDGWGLQVVMREFVELLRASEERRPARLEPVRPYRDHIAWLLRQDQGAAEAFWRRALRGFRVATPLPFDRELPGMPDEGEWPRAVRLRLPASVGEALKGLARRYRVTVNTLFQAVWALVLARFSDRHDVVFGATVSGRPPDLAGVESMVGIFINTSPVRVRIAGDATLVDWLGELQEWNAEMRQYSYCGLFDVAGWSDVAKGQPLFESVLLFQNFPEFSARSPTEPAVPGGVTVRQYRSREQSSYALTLQVLPLRHLAISLAFDGRRFDLTTTARMLKLMKSLIGSFVEGPQRRLRELEVHSSAERHQLLVDGNDTAAPLAGDSVRAPFEAQARRTPDHVAVATAEGFLSYRELDRRAAILARALRSRRAAPERRVGVFMERTPELIVALLGIVKTGAAYVALDPLYPRQRLAFILAESRVAAILTQERLVADLPPAAALAICVDTDWPAIVARVGLPVTGATPGASPAYVLYTSGSTGRPKGVAIAHRSLATYTTTAIRLFDLTAADRLLQFASINFDTSAEEIFPALATGATLTLRNERMLRSPAAFLATCRRWGITVLDLPTAYWHDVVAALEEGGAELPPALRLVIVGGESASPERVAAWRRRAPGVRLLNTYGPTEATIVATAGALDAAGAPVTLGRPIRHARVRVIGRRGMLLPFGVAGELHLGGVGLARGYLGRPARTAAAFVPDAWNDRPGERLYRSGDRARWRRRGTLEFLGRIDHQVKVRGLRIELGEIERTLERHPEVAAAVVLARANSGSAGGGEQTAAHLAAWVVCRSEARPSAGDLRRHLKATLPFYMLPAAFAFPDDLPRTPNGKIDRRALASTVLPGPGAEVPASDLVAPRDEVERQIAEIWARVMRVHSASIRTDFFDLGGHSLLAVRLMAEIEQLFGVSLPLAILFRESTIEGLARVIRKRRPVAPASPLVEIRGGGSRPPFFCVHASGGHVLCYADLFRRLDPEQPVYGLEAGDRRNARASYAEIADMAARYLVAIRERQPRGPYRLGGWSLGGQVAFEIARRIVAQGGAVAVLALIDPAAPPAPDGRPYPGPVTLFRPAGGETARSADGWSRLAGEIELCRVAGDHFSMIREPAVRTLAERLDALLEDAHRATPRAGGRADG